MTDLRRYNLIDISRWLVVAARWSRAGLRRGALVTVATAGGHRANYSHRRKQLSLMAL